MGVEIFVQHLARVLTEVASLSSGVQEPRSQDHHGLASGLFQLNLNGVELPIDDVDHPVDLLGCDGSGPGLLPQQVHHVGCELLAALKCGDVRRAPILHQSLPGHTSPARSGKYF